MNTARRDEGRAARPRRFGAWVPAFAGMTPRGVPAPGLNDEVYA